MEDHVILLQNERDEWELPGGKPMPGETPEDTVAREISEELNIPVTVGDIVDMWMYEIYAGATVLVITYRCSPMST
ncbi:MAG: NUDIX domain-containing protein, partial [Actinomycetota bacterium]